MQNHLSVDQAWSASHCATSFTTFHSRSANWCGKTVCVCVCVEFMKIYFLSLAPSLHSKWKPLISLCIFISKFVLFCRRNHASNFEFLIFRWTIIIWLNVWKFSNNKSSWKLTNLHINSHRSRSYRWSTWRKWFFFFFYFVFLVSDKIAEFSHRHWLHHDNRV